MASSTVEDTTAPPTIRNAPPDSSAPPSTAADSRRPQAPSSASGAAPAAAPGAAHADGEPLLLPEASATPASYPAADASTDDAKPAAAEKTAAAAPAAATATKEKVEPTPQVEALNLLLRGELAAIETYRQALAKAGKETGAEDLEALQRDHREASGVLWQHIQRHGGEPAKGAGAWGAVAKALEGAAKLFGNVTALAMLKEGEAHGVGLYRDALDHSELEEDCVAAVRPLLAKQQEHVAVLEKLIAQAGDAADAGAKAAR